MRYIQSLLHPSTHVKRERTERKTSRLQAHKQPHQEGLAFCLRVILDSDAHRWVQAGHPRYTGASAEEGRGWPDVTSTKTTNDNRGQDTDKRQDKRACNDQVLRIVNSHTVVLDSYTINHTFFFSQSTTLFFSINHTFFFFFNHTFLFLFSINHTFLFLFSINRTFLFFFLNQSHIPFFSSINHTFLFFSSINRTREQTRRHKSRSGDVPDRQEHHP